MSDPHTPADFPDDFPGDDDTLAAEYVLGALSLAERSAADTRLRRDPSFAARVSDWEQRLSGLNDAYDDAPAPNLLPQIEARLFPQPAPRRTAWLTGLMGFALSTVAALGIVAFFLLQPPSPSLTATLTADASPVRYSAEITNDTLTLAQIAGAPAQADKVYQLWLIAGDNAPVSLGLIEGNTLSIPALGLDAGVVLAISLEPAGGSPTGQPTGPVVAAGALAKS